MPLARSISSRGPRLPALLAALGAAGCQALSGLSDYEVGAGGGAGGAASAATATAASSGGGGAGGEGGAACTPAEEVCGNGLDEDCDQRDCSEPLGAAALGGATFQVPYAVAVLPDGAVAVAGTYADGAMTIGDDVLPAAAADRYGIFLAVLETDGTPRWGFGIPDGAGSLPVVAIGADGAIFLGARFAGTIELVPGEPLQAGTGGEPVVVRFDDEGAPVWAVAFDGSGASTVRDLEVRAGEVLVAGSFTAALDLGTGVSITASGQDTGAGGGTPEPDVDGFVGALDADSGEALGAMGVGSPEHAPHGVTGAGYVAAGDVAIVAPFVAAIDLGEPHQAAAGFAVARLGADGAPLWRRFVQTPDLLTSGIDLHDVAFGGGRVAVVARLHGTWEHVDPEANATTSLAATDGDGDLFVAVWSADGDLVWSKQLGDDAEQSWLFQRVGVALDDDGGVTLAAGFRGEVDPGDGPVASVDGDWLIAAWSPDGDLRWSRTAVAEGGSDGATCVAIDPASGDTVVGGTTMAPLDVTDPPLEPIDGAAPTVVVARFAG